jgi:hypothetical protein
MLNAVQLTVEQNGLSRNGRSSYGGPEVDRWNTRVGDNRLRRPKCAGSLRLG